MRKTAADLRDRISPPHEDLRERKRAETRAALVRAARTLFGQKGYYGAGTHEIVAAAEVTRGALQHHFQRKEDLFRTVFEEVLRDMVERATLGTAGSETPGTWRRLKADLLAYLHAVATPEVRQIVLSDGPAVLGWSEWRRLEALHGLDTIIRGVEQGIESKQIRRQSPGPLSNLILALIQEAALLVAHAPDQGMAAQQAQLALDTLLSRLA